MRGIWSLWHAGGSEVAIGRDEVPEFRPGAAEEGAEGLCQGIQSLAKDMNVRVDTMKLALHEEFFYHS